jgi:hypothetical protein
MSSFYHVPFSLFMQAKRNSLLCTTVVDRFVAVVPQLYHSLYALTLLTHSACYIAPLLNYRERRTPLLLTKSRVLFQLPQSHCIKDCAVAVAGAAATVAVVLVLPASSSS